MDKQRIKYLEKKYSETNVARGEILSKATISRINKNYNSNQKRRRVDGVLNEVKNRDSIKGEVHQIISTISLKDICRTCKEEVIIAVIILYVQKTRNHSYYPERTALWRKYNLDWKTYSLILCRLLEETRKQTLCPE